MRIIFYGDTYSITVVYKNHPRKLEILELSIVRKIVTFPREKTQRVMQNFLH